ncbi:hypothetical protein C453_18945 [Haloferax elongans ATCC BAA-1513]|uniref:Uncharacterized protein n=1 Tax=Haloferax elongans ATCC BAA-1513 TaxID=1230453 RepID=M0HD95_HALEO|nr:hypothetical protein [Haloferax elongans]ELZ81044.1 hypothetical protein C453_18945 [Haloferax elongans ATCC BAA-1513]
MEPRQGERGDQSVPEQTRLSLLTSNLRRLDRQACRAFVADLWAARGFETQVDGAVIRATRGGRRTTILPVSGQRRDRFRSSNPSVSGVEIDVVASFGTNNRGARLADEHDARHLDATALSEMLLYALDHNVADALCERHFGAPLDGLLPPLSTRTQYRIEYVRQRVSRVGRRVTSPVARGFRVGRNLVPDTPQTSRGVATLLVVALLVSGAAVALGLVDNPFDEDGHSGSNVAQTTAQSGDSAANQATAIPPDGTGRFGDTLVSPPMFPEEREQPPLEPVEAGELAGVPGVGPTGITNLTALSAAHQTSLENRSYTLWIDEYRPRDDDPNETRVQYDTDVTVDGDRYFVAENVEAGRTQVRLRAVYYDGTDWYVAERENGTERVRRIGGNTSAPSMEFDPGKRNESLVGQYLATLKTNVTGKVRSGTNTYYRIEGETRPTIGSDGLVRDYRFVAYVDKQGFVADAMVTYVHLTSDGPVRVQFEWTYGRLDETTLTPPPWAEEIETADDAPP